MEGDDTVYHHHHHAPITMVTGTNPAQTQPEASIAGETAPPAGKVERGAGGGGGVAPPPPPPHHADPRWDGGGGAGLNKGGLLPPLVDAQAPAQPQATEAPGAAAAGGGGVSVKMATTVLQPFCLGDSPVVLSGGQSICLGDGPVVLPIHLQMSGGAPGAVPSLHGQMGALHGQMGATPYFMTSQGAVSLPLVLDPQLLQHLSSQMASGCPALPLQNNVLCQNASLTFGLPPPLPPPPPPPSLDQKSSGGSSSPDSNLLSLLQNPAFAAILQDLFTSQAAASSTACQSPGSAPGATDPFASAFFTSPPPPPHAPPPPLSHPYASPLAPLVPPATLLVPYPVVIPLPVPLPIPLPIPVPVAPRHGGAGEDSKGDVVRRSVCTVSRSTQTTSTCTRDATSSSSSSSHTFSPRFAAAPPQPQPPHAGPPPHSSGEGEVLDLSVRLCPAAVQPKLEFPPSPPQQDDVLDLSVAGSGCKKKYIQAAEVPSSRASSLGAGGGHREFGGREELVSASGAGGGPAALSLGVLRPMECVPTTLDSKQLLVSGLASLEFSRQHKWLQVDAGGALSRSEALGGGGSLAGGNLEIVSASSQAAANRVIVSVKDAIPAFLCGKIKGLSGVSTKNFSIKRDGGGGGGGGGVGVAGPVQQLYGPLPPPPPPPPASNGTAAPPGGLPPSPAGEHHDPGGDPLGRKAPKNRALKVKKVGSQEIHFLPIKKQRLAAFLPRK